MGKKGSGKLERQKRDPGSKREETHVQGASRCVRGEFSRHVVRV